MHEVDAPLQTVWSEGLFTEGVELTTTALFDEAVQPLASVTVTEYVPDAAGCTFDIFGLEIADVKPFGPVHA